MEATKAAKIESVVSGNEGEQLKLRFEKVIGPREFTREGTLDAVAKLIVTNDEVSVLTILSIVQANFFWPVIGIGEQHGVSKLSCCDETQIY